MKTAGCAAGRRQVAGQGRGGCLERTARGSSGGGGRHRVGRAAAVKSRG
jgi:hypothetical protein